MVSKAASIAAACHVGCTHSCNVRLCGVQTGKLEGQPGRTLMESFEAKVNSVLNKARDDAGNITVSTVERLYAAAHIMHLCGSHSVVWQSTLLLDSSSASTL